MKHLVFGLISVLFIIGCSRGDQGPTITEMLESIDAIEIGKTIQSFSGFKTRYHRSPEAIKAQEWLKSQWEELAQNRSDVSVELYPHPEEVTPMPSVVATIKGTTHPEEIIVLGAHADSIVYPSDEEIERLFGEETEKLHAEENPPEEGSEEERRVIRSRVLAIIGNMNLEGRSPGADDNASGIATITEILRVLMHHNYRPTRTIMFMGYAAEEIGLIGSEDIATSFKEEDRKVISALNFDLTNYRGSPDLDLVMMSNGTSSKQNKFLEEIIGIYLPEITWEYEDQCDGCSDHASWHEAGFRVSMLTEARYDEITPELHKSTDTFEASGGTAEHSVTFAKLGLAFTVEIDRFGLCRYDQEKCNR